MRKKILILLLSVCLTRTNAFSQQFKISYSASAFNQPFSGRLILYLNKEDRNPKDAPVTIQSFPCFSVLVKEGRPGAPVTVDDKADAFPARLSDIERGEYYVQAVWDRNLGGRAIGESPGNLYSKPVRVIIDKDYNRSFSIVCDQIIPEKGFTETTFVKELKVPSELLSSFHKKPMTVGAAIVLPDEYYKEPQRKFPVLFQVFGYGGDYHQFSGDTIRRSRPIDSIACITVYLDGNCALGHSVYANSDNNGPWGDALVKEFIPRLEKTYRCDGARLVWGHSSGGWTVLWLQTHYPEIFTACWSSSPDPVDLRSFQKIDLYAGDNLFYDKDSNLRLVATVAGRIPWATQKQAYQQEYIIYRGEQMHSFDAVFGPRGTDGNPISICDPVTGELNKEVFEHWKNYDISLYLRDHWNTLEKVLKGKIRVSVGNDDNFLLNWAVHLLDGEMKKLDTGFEFAYYPGDHFTLGTTEYFQAGAHFLSRKYKEWKKSQP